LRAMANPVPESGSFYENVKDFLGSPAGPMPGAAPTAAPISGPATYRLGSGLAPPMTPVGFPLGSAVAPPMIGHYGYGFGGAPSFGFGGPPGLGLSAPFVSRPAYGAPGMATSRPVSFGPARLPYQAPYQATSSLIGRTTPVPVSPGPVSPAVSSFQPPLLSSAPFSVRGVSSYAPAAYPVAPQRSYAPGRISSGILVGGSLASVRY